MQTEQSKSERDQRGAAFHEAGHAVLAWALGLAVGRVEIAIDGDDAKGAADISEDASLGLLDQLAICAAGLEAQNIFDAPTHEGAGWGDYGKMVELLEDLEDAEQTKMVHQGHARAFELVSAHRVKVERLAMALMEKKHLGAVEVAALLAD
ncbi:hypothetical protein [Bradyrhizobium sp. NAS96.2]|uniref:hypothetical protein n=1 Tax=Bradyrhizobium sp. NAS96.2 TaxID=1680160 RepID=UPI00093D2F7B|nr:hypothetical protein [Bradyrhizobium sp. NAS96.2]OKO83746.1 hypothetical protein AC628_01170 [Bradyrhizobium sp. NAS96.2]